MQLGQKRDYLYIFTNSACWKAHPELATAWSKLDGQKAASQIRRLPILNGKRVSPPGRLSSPLSRPTSFSWLEKPDFSKARFVKS